MDYRQKARKIFGEYSKIPKNIDILEKRVFSMAPEEKEYLEIVYQIAYLFSNGKKIKEILTILKEGRIGYKHDDYNLCLKKQQEYDEYLINPFSVKQGLVDCVKCGSKRTMSYYKQDRSADEGTSVYSQCLDCMTKWRMNN